jgi:hypothetical protein
VIYLSLLDIICSSLLLVCMIRLLPGIIIMFYLQLFWINSYGNLIIYSTTLIGKIVGDSVLRENSVFSKLG